MNSVKRTQAEIEELMNEAAEKEEDGDLRAEAIHWAFMWLFGDTDDYPL